MSVVRSLSPAPESSAEITLGKRPGGQEMQYYVIQAGQQQYFATSQEEVERLVQVMALIGVEIQVCVAVAS